MNIQPEGFPVARTSPGSNALADAAKQSSHAAVQSQVGTGSEIDDSFVSSTLSPKAVANALEQMNQAVQSKGLKVEIDTSAPANQLWINVIDQASGQVIEKLPPQTIRQMVEKNDYRGFMIDEKF